MIRKGFDNVIIKVGEWDGQVFNLEILPLLNGRPVRNKIFFQAFLWGESGIVGHERHQFDDATDKSAVFGTLDCAQQLVQYWVYYDPSKAHKWTVSGSFPDRLRLVVVLPEGNVVQSDEMVWEAPQPPV